MPLEANLFIREREKVISTEVCYCRLPVLAVESCLLYIHNFEVFGHRKRNFPSARMASGGGEKPLPPQKQEKQPGKEHVMQPRPEYTRADYKPSNKLQGKVALVTGGDSGIGRAVCHHFALEGATVAFTYLKSQEDKDAMEALNILKEAKTGSAKDPIALDADLGFEANCNKVVDQVIHACGGIDILVNNAAEQYERPALEDTNEEDLIRVFRTNIFSQFFLVKAALKHMKKGSCIINTTSINAYKGHPTLLDYTATKGAIVAFTRALSLHLVDKGIRVNAVAPGPVWTPLIPASFPEEKVEMFGKEVPMARAAQPSEVAPSYVFLASEDSSYFSGQVLHPNGGVVVNG
ncbi:glucose and ribitol dehydrogenase isoform X2 [Nymphaea colorata]|uniref:glucose and ribitol dehydrogenase isoform X2 n=1 Tax=Nymphaea colorata TaxID=210225 RepID=UPI00214EE5C1|nr:glucose and ribitol dehydrogenase isoform X2 [Nymphaea colorata]